jgi:UPF0755 protein
MKRAAAIIVVAFLAVACVSAAVGYWLIAGDRAFPQTATTLEIPEGSGLKQIGDQLASGGVVRSASLLKLYVRSRGGASAIQAAVYDFPAHRTIEEVAAILAAGGKPPVVWVTIPEGFTAAQIGGKLAGAGLFPAGAFLAYVRTHRAPYSGTRSLPGGLEGFLFPDTYQLRRSATPDEAAAAMLDRFHAQLPRDYAEAARRQGFSVAQIVIVASMIEREAKVDQERPLIASVIYNRLHDDMPLEIDATVEYALPHHKAELSFADIGIDSPYNTYRHTGLPPGPISNPGKPSLDAAFHPATTPYFYYVAEGNGHHAFSVTLDEQQQNERRYLH